MIPAVRIRGLSKNYRQLQALRDIDLDIAQGEFFGLLGPNGAGKTTLISILAGLVRADAGEVAVMGHDVARDYRAARASLGVVPQELVFDPFFNVRETLRMQSGYFGLRHNDDWIDEVMQHLDLTDKAERNMRQLSGGMKRRVLVAQALVHKPPVIVLDEPTAGVDVELRKTLWAFIARLNRDGHTVILTTHYLEEAQSLCTRIAMLKQGRVVALDDTRAFLDRFSERQLKLRLGPDQALPEALAARQVRTEADGTHVLALADHAQLEQALAALRECGCTLLDIEVGKPDLEAVFLRIMADAGGNVAATRHGATTIHGVNGALRV
jgi:ABC-2 type transport system ATP-binding protein